MELIINSPKYGAFTVLYDVEDHEVISKYNWSIRNHKTNIYAYPNARKVAHIAMHTMIMGGKWVDHKNGNGLDNRRQNLRFASRGNNVHNSRPQMGSTTKFKGVSYYAKRDVYYASIKKDGSTVRSSVTRNIYKAAILYNEWATELFGEFAWLNKLTEEEIALAKQPAVIRQHSTNTTGFRGVCFISGTKKFRATLYVNGKMITKSNFNSAEDAAKEYDRMVIQYGKPLDFLNFVDGKKVYRGELKDHINNL